MSNDGIMQNLFVDEDELKVQEEIVAKEEVKLPAGDVNTVELPSKGLLGYPSHIEYREMMVADEEILASATVASYTKTLNAVLKSVLNDCPFYEKMTLADRDWALIWVWANNYSPMKNVEVTCSNEECGKKHVHTVDLTKLPVIDIKENIGRNFPKQIRLSKTGGYINVNMITVADELFVDDFITKNASSKDERKSKYADLRVEHALLVRSIDVGVPIPFEKKLEWVASNVTSLEMGKIRKLHTHFRYGLDSYYEYKCPACKEVTQGEIPFQIEDVLYPTIPDDFEDLISD